MRKRIVGVVGAGEASRQDLRNARRLGMLLARNGWVVLSGGRDAGVMEAVTRGAKSVRGSVTVGILPSSTTPPSRYVDIVIVTDMHNARNNINVLSSDVVVACGMTGTGTVSEIALALKASKPVIVLGGDELSLKFFARLGGDLIIPAVSPEDVIQLIKRHGLCG